MVVFHDYSAIVLRLCCLTKLSPQHLNTPTHVPHTHHLNTLHTRTQVIIAALDWTTAAVSDFGARSFPTKPIITMAHGMVAHRDGKVHQVHRRDAAGQWVTQSREESMERALRAAAERRLADQGLR